jgi:hypothetical protein
MHLRTGMLILGSLLCVSGRADDLRGFYAGAALSRATLELKGTLSTPRFEGESTGLKLLGGYRLTDRFAVEGAYLDLGNARGDSPFR